MSFSYRMLPLQSGNDFSLLPYSLLFQYFLFSSSTHWLNKEIVDFHNFTIFHVACFGIVLYEDVIFLHLNNFSISFYFLGSVLILFFSSLSSTNNHHGNYYVDIFLTLNFYLCIRNHNFRWHPTTLSLWRQLEGSIAFVLLR